MVREINQRKRGGKEDWEKMERCGKYRTVPLPMEERGLTRNLSERKGQLFNMMGPR